MGAKIILLRLRSSHTPSSFNDNNHRSFHCISSFPRPAFLVSQLVTLKAQAFNHPPSLPPSLPPSSSVPPLLEKQKTKGRYHPLNLGKVGVDKVPVDELVEEVVHVLRAHVLHIQVVGVLPHIDHQQGGLGREGGREEGRKGGRGKSMSIMLV